MHFFFLCCLNKCCRNYKSLTRNRKNKVFTGHLRSTWVFFPSIFHKDLSKIKVQNLMSTTTKKKNCILTIFPPSYIILWFWVISYMHQYLLIWQKQNQDQFHESHTFVYSALVWMRLKHVLGPTFQIRKSI